MDLGRNIRSERSEGPIFWKMDVELLKNLNFQACENKEE